MIQKEVEKLLRGGTNIASVKTLAEVCLHCGERYYSPEVIELFEKTESELEKNETQNFKILGRSFQVAF